MIASTRKVKTVLTPFFASFYLFGEISRRRLAKGRRRRSTDDIEANGRA